jgi:uncharacterized protein (DUF983 family)
VTKKRKSRPRTKGVVDALKNMTEQIEEKEIEEITIVQPRRRSSKLLDCKIVKCDCGMVQQTFEKEKVACVSCGKDIDTKKNLVGTATSKW